MGRLIVILLMFGATAQAQVYQIRVGNGSASAVCVGSNSPAIFVTAKHVFREGTSGQVSDGQRWAQIRNVRIDSEDDLATFEAPGRYVATGLVENVPDGVDVTACGWNPDRTQFCFKASVSGDWLYARNNDHSMPGDSGGGAFVETSRGRCMVGMPVGYTCDRRSNNRCESLIVSSRSICRFLRTQYGNCPTCPQYQAPRPIQRPTQPQPRPQVNTIPGGCSVVVDYDRVAREVYERYGDRLRGKDGDSPTLDIDVLASVITDKYADRIRDPRIIDLIERLEKLEASSGASSPGDLQSFSRRLQVVEGRKHSQRVLLVDGSTNRVIDDETYTDEPIVLDVQKFIRAAK